MFDTRLFAAVLAAALLLAACGESAATTITTTATTMAMSTGEDGDDHEMDFSFGTPADSTDATRTIEVVAGDDLRFSPSTVTVSAGETVTFRIVNSGQLPHDFTLGDAAAQEEHEAEMAEMGGVMIHDEPNAVSVPAGETKELTWRFGDSGTVLYGCHQTGHYAAGMKGEISLG